MTKISGIFAASMSVLNSDLSLNIEKTINHAEKLIDQGCHGTAIFGSTGQAQLIPVSEKIKLLNNLSESKYKDKHLIGTGLNSLNETINFMKIATSLSFKNFFTLIYFVRIHFDTSPNSFRHKSEFISTQVRINFGRTAVRTAVRPLARPYGRYTAIQTQ